MQHSRIDGGMWRCLQVAGVGMHSAQLQADRDRAVAALDEATKAATTAQQDAARCAQRRNNITVCQLVQWGGKMRSPDGVCVEEQLHKSVVRQAVMCLVCRDAEQLVLPLLLLMQAEEGAA